MKNLELENFAVVKLNEQELVEISGGYSEGGFFKFLLEFSVYIGLLLLFSKATREW